MKILAIDSSAGLTVGLHDGNKPVISLTRDDHGVQGELAAEFIQQALIQANWSVDSITDVVVGVGPGPYTGLRVGIVTAAMFAHARRIPIHGVCSLDAIGHAHAGKCIAVSDARRKELYWAEYESGRRIGHPQVSTPAELVRQHPDAMFVGPGVDLYPDVVSGKNLALQAVDLADLYASGNALLVEVAPMYLRKPDADEPAPRKQVTT